MSCAVHTTVNLFVPVCSFVVPTRGVFFVPACHFLVLNRGSFCNSFCTSMSFAGCSIDDALRLFLAGFWLPGL
eukprot:2096295-Rhodomonas_salina.5